MSSRSDVSKMLVSRQQQPQKSSRASSVVNSTSNCMTKLNSCLIPGSSQRPGASDTPKQLASSSRATPRGLAEKGLDDTRKAARGHTGLSAPDRQPHTRSQQQSRSAVTSAPAHSYGFLQMKCLDVLKSATSPMHIQEIQVALGPEYPVASNRDFLSHFRLNPRVTFNSATKRWSFNSPYKNILTSKEAIIESLQKKGLEITSEVLEYNSETSKWLNAILAERRCRAVRGTKVARCKVYSSESGLFCDLYTPQERCDSCQSLQGVVLYQLGAEHLENVQLDGDVKELWHKIPSTTAADVEAILGATQRANLQLASATAAGNAGGRTRRKRPAGARAPRVQKIANLHVYTTEEFKKELASTEHAASASTPSPSTYTSNTFTGSSSCTAASFA